MSGEQHQSPNVIRHAPKVKGFALLALSFQTLGELSVIVRILVLTMVE